MYRMSEWNGNERCDFNEIIYLLLQNIDESLQSDKAFLIERVLLNKFVEYCIFDSGFDISLVFSIIIAYDLFDNSLILELLNFFGNIGN